MDAIPEPKIEIQFSGEMSDVPGGILILHDEYSRAFKQCVEILRQMVKSRCPVGATHSLYGSIRSEMEDLTSFDAYSYPVSPPSFRGVVYSDPGTSFFYPSGCGYAAAVESGAAPHWPNFLSILAWVGAVLGGGDGRWFQYGKIGMGRSEEWITAFLVSRNISRIGTRGQFMFQSAEQDFRGVMPGIMAAARNRAEERMTKEELPWWAK